MKQYNKMSMRAFLIASMLFVLSSCSDFLDRDHPTQVSDDEFWKTMNECQKALDEIKIWVKGAYGGHEISWVFLEGATDNMHFQGNFELRVTSLGNGSLVAPTEGNTPSSWEDTFKAWEYYYKHIRRCNRFLKFVDNAYFSDETERTRMVAEVRIWRAWLHMRLLVWYGRNDGVPIVEKDLLPAEVYMARNSVEECLEFINKELDLVINSTDLPFLWDEDRRDRMSISSALVLKMDLNLQFKQYAIAKDAAKKLIESDKFELYYSSNEDDTYVGKNYRDLFRYVGAKNKERIMFKKNGLNDIWFRNMTKKMSGQGVSSVLKSFVDTYETIDGKTIQSLASDEKQKYEREPLHKERDPRLHATVFTSGDNTTFANYTYLPFEKGDDYFGDQGAVRSGYMMKKFLDENDRSSGNGSLDFMLYRYAEVLLDYVECLVETGEWQHGDVEKYINMIRARAGMPNMDKSVYNTEAKVRELYRRERRVELAFEGKRYDDIRRWGIGNEVMQGPIYGAWNPKDQSFIRIETRNCAFPKYDSWPLHQQEVTANENIEQPLGW